jgi:hypothetical protein
MPASRLRSFTTGKTQIDRYDLGQVASRLDYDPADRVLNVYGRDGNHLQTYDVEKPEDLVPLIGKDAADRLMRNPIEAGSDTNYILSGEALQVGGAGMTHFYDEVLPAKLQKLLEPFGGTVERGRIDTLPTGARRQNNRELEGTEAWIAKLSPEMKQQIREKGFPMLLLLLAMKQAEEATTD